MFHPKFFTTFKDYSWSQFYHDLIAGVVVGIVALPLAIAFGIASGVTPEQGLITAVIGGFVISFLGGSRVQIGGPTGAFIVIVYGVIQLHGVDGLIIATAMAGILLVIMGLLRVGTVIKFMPYPVIVGFTSGIAVVIFASQIRDLFGLSIANLPADFVDKLVVYFGNFDSFNPYATGIGFLTILTIGVWPWISRRIPGSVIAIVLTTILVHLLELPVETIGSRFGEINTVLPAPTFPKVEFSRLQELIQPAFTIAMLAAIESLLSAMVADGMIGGQHRSNTELIGQGVANIIVPFFGGIPATGAIARTVTNIKNGGRTPVAGMIHAVTLLLILLFLGRWAVLIPMSCLAGILIVVAYNMSEWRSFKSLFNTSRSEVLVLLTTFFLTVFFDLSIAIEVGLLLALLLFMRRMTTTADIRLIKNEDTSQIGEVTDMPSVPAGVELFEINGPFFFGVANKFEETLKVVADPPKVRIIRMRNVPFIDSTGLYNLKNLIQKSQRSNTKIMLSEVNKPVLSALVHIGLVKQIGRVNIFHDLGKALAAAEKIATETPRQEV